MAADVDLKYDLIGGSVKRLLKLHDVVEQMQRTVGALRDRQTSAVWPNVEGLSAFATRYRVAINVAEDDLASLRQELAEASQALAASLRAFEQRDAAEADRMRTLLAALDSAGTITPAPSAPSVGRTATTTRGSY
ncbi:hypothetical protein [Cellulomonas triticagri]|uniref:Uncharacterized protein n=1 Tax=Cellulomonas triticagri TaxID=2483352 RepID=A0A3M2IUN8_9CELL|nr:hypothetical protein [Cellulomonas triticagri]RMI03576.1 hypothetical protein EBM89_19135 [Cellulomonas triticagri]